MNWIVDLKNNPDAALKNLYDSYSENCIKWAISEFGLDLNSAQEIVQVSFVILYENVVSGKLAEARSSVKTYLFAIIKNKIYQQTRHNNKFTSLDSANIIADTVSEGEEDLFSEHLQKARESLSALGDPCKKMLELFYFEGKSLDEVSLKMEYKNSDTTKNLKYKCIKRLQKIFFE
jgi:RNA polymerase sigma factor (sigma-70 family)